MATIRFIHLDAEGRAQLREVQAARGRSVMRAAVEARVDGIVAECGGVLTCATCHVYVAPEWAARLPAPSADELDLLEFTAAPRRDGSRLSCQIAVDDALDGLTLEVPVRQF